jgi:glycosyltransferase involved in cell wall biosynthesis
VSESLRVLLLGNYAPDRQESMQRFRVMLEHGLTSRGVSVRSVAPPASFPTLDHSAGGKWVGYLDKFSRFRALLPAQVAWADVVHVCDHSNAMYCGWIADRPTLVTCHDLLAVRGARGEDTDCPASCSGRVLQEWIVSGLRRADMVAAVSSYTRADARRIIGGASDVRLVLNGLNHDFRPLVADEARARLAGLPGFGQRPYLLNVGSNLPRKNRAGVLRVFAHVRRRHDIALALVGQGLSPELASLADRLGIRPHIHECPGVDNRTLEALYAQAHALLFPSRFEGFGWPIVEAQASGCPVVCSDCGPFREVAGEGAAIRPLEDEAGMAEDLHALFTPAVRQRMVAAGLANAARFTCGRMLDDYASLYRELGRRRRP